MPAARARTCATREASVRPGSSATRPTAAGVATTTPTGTGGGAAGSGALAAGPQADRNTAHDQAASAGARVIERLLCTMPIGFLR